MELFWTDPAAVKRLGDFGDVGCEVLSRSGARSGQPFLLGPDGAYDIELNRFLRELPVMGARASHTIAAYARDLAVFCRFLHASRGGKSIWQMERADCLAFKHARLATPGFEVTSGTWNRFVTVLDKFVFWAIDEQLLEESPFRYRELRYPMDTGFTTVMVNGIREPMASEPIQFVSFEDYLLWRDVGLRGLFPDGQMDPAWAGRNGERNAAFADLLVFTGMRLSEASSLLDVELPQGSTTTAARTRLSAAVTKRNKPRDVWIDRRTMRRIRGYVDIERDAVIQRRLADGGLQGEELVPVTGSSGSAVKLIVDGRPRTVSFAKLGLELRPRLVWSVPGRAGAPLMLWLTEDGRPMDRTAWQSVFYRANERCARLGVAVQIHPHTLRHTFAVNMLGLLLRETIRRLGPDEVGLSTSSQLKRLLLGDPLRKLQLLLGHRNIDTTMVYLDNLDDANEIVLQALAHWGDQAAALEQMEAA